MIAGFCNRNGDLPVEQAEGTFVELSTGQDLFIGEIEDIVRAGDNYYAVDDRSRIIMFDSGLQVLTYIEVPGQGPGEIARSAAMRKAKDGLWVFDSESLKFVLYNDSLDFIKEFPAPDLFPHLGFTFLVKDSEIYTADNSTNSLISVFNLDFGNHPDSLNPAPVDEIGVDLTFFDKSSRSQSRDNLYHIHRYGDDLVLVNRWNPVILIVSRRNGTYEVVNQYQYEDVEYFKRIIQSNNDFHIRDENAYSWKRLVWDSEIFNNNLVMLMATEESGSEFSSNILVLELRKDEIEPKQIYQMGLEANENPWIHNIIIDEGGNLLSVASNHSDLIRFELNLN